MVLSYSCCFLGRISDGKEVQRTETVLGRVPLFGNVSAMVFRK
jgi:hypothetical protein